MYLASFIYRPGMPDPDFHRLNDAVAQAARDIDGYLGEDSWASEVGGRRMVTYYWRSPEALAAFARHARHRAAKREQQRWYEGYHVIISEVVTTYGDGRLDHVTGDARRKGGPDAG